MLFGNIRLVFSALAIRELLNAWLVKEDVKLLESKLDKDDVNILGDGSDIFSKTPASSFTSVVLVWPKRSFSENENFDDLELSDVVVLLRVLFCLLVRLFSLVLRGVALGVICVVVLVVGLVVVSVVVVLSAFRRRFCCCLLVPLLVLLAVLLLLSASSRSPRLSTLFLPAEAVSPLLAVLLVLVVPVVVYSGDVRFVVVLLVVNNILLLLLLPLLLLCKGEK